MNDKTTTGKAAGSAENSPGYDAFALTAQLGREVGAPLASALERVIALTETGKIRRAGLSALREEIEQALQAGEAAQQLALLLSQEPRLRKQAVDPAQALETSLSRAGAEVATDIRQPGAPVSVQTDPLMLERLMSALVAWVQSRADPPVRWAFEHGRMDTEARLSCTLRLRKPDQEGPGPAPAPGIGWLLVERLCSLLGLRLHGFIEGTAASVRLDFPRLQAAQTIEGMVVEELDPEDAMAFYANAVAGTSLLIVAGRRETRELIEEAVKPLGLVCDFVRSVEEARSFCKNGLPHAIVYEPTVRGSAFEPLRVELVAQEPKLVLVEILDDDDKRRENTVEAASPRRRARRESLKRDLPPMLLHELAASLRA